MSQKTDPHSPKGKMIREQALAVLRDTRAKIDPALLVAMKERLSTLVPAAFAEGAKPQTAAEKPKIPAPKISAVPQQAAAAYQAAMKPFAKALDKALSEQPASDAPKARNIAPTTAALKPDAGKANVVMPVPGDVKKSTTEAKTALPKSTGPVQNFEPVDRQKITQIVLEYMKLRKESQKH